MLYLKIVVGIVVAVLLLLLIKKFFHWIILVAVVIGLGIAYYYIRQNSINPSDLLR